jgi:hypothetical protein
MVVVGLDYGHAGQMTLEGITGGSPLRATTISGADGIPADCRRVAGNALSGLSYRRSGEQTARLSVAATTIIPERRQDEEFQRKVTDPSGPRG